MREFHAISGMPISRSHMLRWISKQPYKPPPLPTMGRGWLRFSSNACRLEITASFS